MNLKFRSPIILIALLLSILITYGFYTFWPQTLLLSPKHVVVLVSSLIISFCTIGCFGFSIISERTTFLVRIVAIVFFLLGLASNILLSIFAVSHSTITIAIGIEFILYLLIIYSLIKANQ